MKSNLEELINDINAADKCQVFVCIHTGSEVIVKSAEYTNLRVGKDSEGKIWLGIGKEVGYLISDEFDITKDDDLVINKRAQYKIEKDGITYVTLYLYKN